MISSACSPRRVRCSRERANYGVPQAEFKATLDELVTQRSDLEVEGARIISLEGVEVRLQVRQQDLQHAVSTLLQKLPIVDLTVEDPPLEEVLGDLFESVQP